MAVDLIDNQVQVLEDSSPGPFEGPEKLLEFWFAPNEKAVPAFLDVNSGAPSRGNGQYTGLRRIEKEVWDGMLDEVCCKVLSVIEGEDADSYLLSESSMFVWPHKLILKTCGTTTLLLGIPTLLRLAESCGFKGVWRCFYSRKTFMFPELQKGPHRDWNEEMKFLDQIFNNSSAYTVGRMNGDHWLLYITPPRDDVLLPTSMTVAHTIPRQSPTNSLSVLSASFPPAPHRKLPLLSRSLHTTHGLEKDQTLEILMTGLAPAVCQQFNHPNPGAYPEPGSTILEEPSSLTSPSSGHTIGTKLADKLGINALFPPGTIVDSFMFDPCGYSMNAINKDRYATIHVTPEVEWSYASYETNFSFPPQGEDYESDEDVLEPPAKVESLIKRVLNIFKPSKLSITLFVSSEEEGEEEIRPGMKELLTVDLLEKQNYNRVDRIVYEFAGYKLVYAVFEHRTAHIPPKVVG